MDTQTQALVLDDLENAVADAWHAESTAECIIDVLVLLKSQGALARLVEFVEGVHTEIG